MAAVHPRIMEEFRRQCPKGEPTWRALIEAAGRVIESMEKENSLEKPEYKYCSSSITMKRIDFGG